MKKKNHGFFLVHLVLIGLLVSFNNCSGGFQSTPLSEGPLESSSGSGSSQSQELPLPQLRVNIDGLNFIITWTDAGSPDHYDIIIDNEDLPGERRVTGKRFTATGLSAGQHCFRVKANYTEHNTAVMSNEVCQTTSGSNTDDSSDDDNDNNTSSRPITDPKSYFVRSGKTGEVCSDTWSGRQPVHTTGTNGPWCSLNTVKSRVRELGSDVYFHSGSEWKNEQLKIQWSGSRNDFAVISCYRMEGNTPMTCRRNQDPRPIFYGDVPANEMLSLTHDWSRENGRLVRRWGGQIEMIGQHYVDLSYIETKYTYAAGLLVQGNQTPGSSSHILVRDMFINGTGMNTAMIFGKGVQNAVVQNNHLKGYNMCKLQANVYGKLEPKVQICSEPGWPGGLMFGNNPNSQSLVENNIIHDGYGEGINCYATTTHMIVRGNIIWSNRSGGIYADNCGHLVAENNILYHHNYTMNGFPLSHYNGNHLSVGLEDQFKSPVGPKLLLFRNNILVDQYDGFRVGIGQKHRQNGAQLYFVLLGNTSVSADHVDIHAGHVSAANINPNSLISNNLLYSPDATAGCSSRGGPTMDFNLWGVRPSDSNCNGRNDRIGNPNFPRAYASFEKADGVTRPVDPLKDLCLPKSSPAIGMADASLFGGSKVFDKSSYGTFIFEYMLNKPSNWSAWEHALGYDFHMRRRTTSRNFVGAVGPCS